MSDKIGIVVLSCDNYSDLWDLVFSSLKHNIDLSYYDIYLLTNSQSYSSDYVNVIHMGEGNSWSEEVYNGVNKIPNEILITTFDDLIIDKFPQNREIKKYIELGYVTSNSVLKLSRSSRTLLKNDAITGLMNSECKSSLVFTILRKELLLKTLYNAKSLNANPWIYETTTWVDDYTCFELFNSPVKYFNLVIKGRVNTISAVICRFKYGQKEYLKMERKKMSLYSCILHNVKELAGKLNRKFNFL